MSCRSNDHANGKSVLSLVLWPKTHWWSVMAPTYLSNNSDHSQCAKAAGPTAPYVVNLCCSVWLVCKLAQTHVIWCPVLVWGSTCWGVIQSFHSLGCFFIGAAAPLFRQPISSTRFLAGTTVWAPAAFSMWLSLLSHCCQNQWSLFLIFVPCLFVFILLLSTIQWGFIVPFVVVFSSKYSCSSSFGESSFGSFISSLQIVFHLL